MRIKLRLREIAERQGLNMQQVADRSGIAYSTIVDWWYDRTRRFDRATLDRLCEALGVGPGELVVREITEDDRIIPALVAA